MTAVPKRLMRHSEIGATMKYYVTMDADAVADEGDRNWDLGGNRPQQAPTTEAAPADPPTEAVDNQDLTQAEGTGLEPATPYGAPHFQTG